jgi:hypothetical protein
MEAMPRYGRQASPSRQERDQEKPRWQLGNVRSPRCLQSRQRSSHALGRVETTFDRTQHFLDLDVEKAHAFGAALAQMVTPAHGRP